MANFLILHFLKKLENQTFSGVFRVYKMRTLALHGLRRFGNFPSFTQKLKKVKNVVRKIYAFCFKIFIVMSLLLVGIIITNTWKLKRWPIGGIHNSIDVWVFTMFAVSKITFNIGCDISLAKGLSSLNSGIYRFFARFE